MWMNIYSKEKQQLNCLSQNKLSCGGFIIHRRISIPAEGI